MGCCGAKAGAGHLADEVKDKQLIDKSKTPSSSAPFADEQGGDDDERGPPGLEEEGDLIGLKAVEPVSPANPAALRSPNKASAIPVPVSPSSATKNTAARNDEDAEQVQEVPQTPVVKSPRWGLFLPSPSASTPKASPDTASPVSLKATPREATPKEGTPREEEFTDVAEEAVATPVVEEVDDGVKAFLAALEVGVVVVKHDRKGKSKKRELYTADMVTFSWREPSSSSSKKPGHERGRSGGGMFEKDRAHYYFEDILEVRRGTMLDPQSSKGETGTPVLRAACDPKDYFKSFSLMLKDRSVDLTCHSIEQMTFLIKGFHAIVAQCKKKRR